MERIDNFSVGGGITGREKQPDTQTRNLGWDPVSAKVDYWKWEKVGGQKRERKDTHRKRKEIVTCS